MPEDRRLTIGSTARLSPDEVGRHTFATSRRGFDPGEVRSFLELIASELMVAFEREQQLRDLLAEAEHRAAHPVLDEATLTAALGNETARVLRSAQDAAAQIMERAEEEIAGLRSEARSEAEALRTGAESYAADHRAEVESAAAEVLGRAEQEAASRLEAVKQQADAYVSQVRQQCRTMAREAQDLRARVLADLASRRRALHGQIEQLRAGRERLAQTIGDTRADIDRIAEEVFRAEDEARLAAEAAGRQAAAEARSEQVLASEHEQTTVIPGSSLEKQLADLVEGEALPTDQRPLATPGGADASRGSSEVVHQDGEVLHQDEANREQAVQELFARLRAARGAIDSDVPIACGEPEASEVKGGAEVLAAADASEIAGPSATDEKESPRSEVDPLLARRDELLAPVVTALSKRVKRALQDDQNDVLDRLRAKGWSQSVLDEGVAHIGRYADAVSEQLEEAARAGALFVGAKMDDAPAVTDIASELASLIVVPLRRKLEDKASSIDSSDDQVLVSHVGAAYREWRGERVERLAADQAIAAFSAATIALCPEGTSTRWLVDDGGDPCPDCDDNALAGSLSRGESFPTGHLHPPAHPGCRCLLVPIDP